MDGELIQNAGYTGQFFCKHCEQYKSEDDFYIVKGKLRYKCKQCEGIYHKMRTYGITKEQYINMLEAQDGRCAICKKDFGTRIDVDHCHDTGEVRGLLCMLCNSGI